jgi:predicted XRE-type DNA-binding protein
MEDVLGPCREWQGARSSKGYGRISYGDGYIWAHRLVWIAAHGEVPEIDGRPGLILHRCDNPPCFRLDHLYAATHSDNMRDRALAGHYGVFGEANGMSKLTEDAVLAIRWLYEEEGWRQQRIADRFGITQVQVSSIVRREAWPHVGAPSAS